MYTHVYDRAYTLYTRRRVPIRIFERNNGGRENERDRGEVQRCNQFIILRMQCAIYLDRALDQSYIYIYRCTTGIIYARTERVGQYPWHRGIIYIHVCMYNTSTYDYYVYEQSQYQRTFLRRRIILFILAVHDSRTGRRQTAVKNLRSYRNRRKSTELHVIARNRSDSSEVRRKERLLWNPRSDIIAVDLVSSSTPKNRKWKLFGNLYNRFTPYIIMSPCKSIAWCSYIEYNLFIKKIKCLS